MTRKNVLLLAFFTLLGFPAVAYYILAHFSPLSFQDIFILHKPLLTQIIVGLLYGFVTSFIGWKIVKTRLLTETREFYTKIFQSLCLNPLEIFFISFCAGIGEEILFRGAIQPLLGIWLTAIIFVAIHGYLNPFKWRITIYGTYMTLIIAGIGYLCNYFGLITAIAAHTMIDIVLLLKLSGYKIFKA